MKRVFLSVMLGFLAVPGWAESPVAPASVTDCIAKAIDESTPAAACVNAAMAPCFADPDTAPAAATLCFREAGKSWGTMMRAALEDAKSDLGARAFDAIEINARYDLLGNLLQCDRMNELALASGANGGIVNVQKARCEATAAGLAYLRLRVQMPPQAKPQTPAPVK